MKINSHNNASDFQIAEKGNFMERDVAHEYDMKMLRKEQLRGDISAEAALEEIQRDNDLCDDMEDAPMGDPDEYSEEEYWEE